MSIVALAIVTALYVVAAVDEAVNGRMHMAVVMGAYAVANCGLMWGMR